MEKKKKVVKAGSNSGFMKAMKPSEALARIGDRNLFGRHC